MISVRTIADWFLSKNSMTHKKLQKLCYYAQAWFCALYDGTPLFDEEIQAWVHGPVIPELYPVFADYRWSEIPKKSGLEFDFSEEVIGVLEAVYNTYGDFTGDQLEALTHSEEPWIAVRGRLKPWESCSDVISCAIMREYYGKKYAEAQND